MHRTPNNTPRSSVLDVTTPLIQQPMTRSCAAPLVFSIVGGVIVTGLLKTMVFNPSMCGVAEKMHLDTRLEQLGAAFAGGVITTVIGTISGYFCQEAPQVNPLAQPINDSEKSAAKQEAEDARRAAENAF